MRHRLNSISRAIALMASSGLLVASAIPAYAQDVEPQGETLEEVVVTGFRASLQRATALKRDAVNARESIVTEDIGKMPDLNLAEAIQRIPGVAIVRQGGEGRQVSLRGLGAGFTHVTLNGMEVPASTGGLDSSGGTNRGRNFDFNVFSAELFSRIDVNKSPTASIEEGGIAGNIDLYTVRPLDKPGMNASVSAQLGYNDLSEESDPRVTATISNTNEDETFGYLLSVAYTERTTFQDGFGTVRWAQPDQDFAANNVLNGVDLREVWFPRLPRQDSFRHEQDRLGVSGALQFRPSEALTLGVNWVHSEFDSQTDSYNSFGEFRRSGGYGYPAITPNAVTLDGTGIVALAGNFDGVGLRTESRQTIDETSFDQFTVDFEYDLNDSMSLSGMVGTASSDYAGEIFRVNIETPTGTNFSYDFTQNENVAAIDYDIDVTSVANFEILDGEQLRSNNIDRQNDTLRLDFDWQLNDSSSLKIGAIMNDRVVDAVEADRVSNDPRNLADLGKIFTYTDSGSYGSATELNFLVLDFDKAVPAFGQGAYIARRGPGVPTWQIEEETTGLYVDYNLDTELAGRGLRVNLGGRYVSTDVTATGFLDVNTPNVETNDYSEFLPSLNLAYDVTEKLVLRAGLARTMTRPDLTSLAPSKAYSDVNFTVSGGNSQLEPLVSDDINLSAEWYFGEDALLAFSYFKKDIDSFISSPTSFEPLRAEDAAVIASIYPTQPGLLDPSLIWRYSSSSNTEGTELDGFEIAYQQGLTFLPGALSNLGVIANYSHVEAETIVTRDDIPTIAPLPGLSENSYNFTLYYEVDQFGARISLNNRDDYVTRNIGSNGNFSENTTGPTHVDFSAFYNLNDLVTFTFEIINLTDEDERLFTTGNGSQNLIREYNNTGRQYFAGVRANF
ncbi:TonB-dependent receptor [Arenicella xantha]|uniref:TonB-dependent receptor n=1 Tax=Arenicella xantha TaxID=644221 RepID=A0A395JNX2_9GAMM|nr:TonB-dependent receptor [Arenicella xantha]RBP53013.1 TonB-dependent receptor [Arenicella xantha]